jgi:sec-independent protein translocase protein TatA
MFAEIFGVDGIIVIAAVLVVLMFGGSKLPKLARSLGSASHEFKKGVQSGDPESVALSAGPTATESPVAKTAERLDI